MTVPPGVALVLTLSAWSALAVGCAAAPGDRLAQWTSDHGGVVRDAAEPCERARSALARLAGPGLPAGLSVRVLGSEVPAAYAWPGGEIFVTRGLVDLLSDDELAAAVAHEAGHLTADPHGHGQVALGGDADADPAAACESAADRAGCELLRGAGLAPAALAAALEKVAAHPLTAPASRPALRDRVAALAPAW